MTIVSVSVAATMRLRTHRSNLVVT